MFKALPKRFPRITSNFYSLYSHYIWIIIISYETLNWYVFQYKVTVLLESIYLQLFFTDCIALTLNVLFAYIFDIDIFCHSTEWFSSGHNTCTLLHWTSLLVFSANYICLYPPTNHIASSMLGHWASHAYLPSSCYCTRTHYSLYCFLLWLLVIHLTCLTVTVNISL